MLETATTIEKVDGRSDDVVVPPPAGPGGVRWPSRLAVLGLVCLLVPVLAALVRAVTGTWLPPSDHALIQIRTMDVGSTATPLLGPYSRLGWNHPGPLLFWLLAIPYRVLGGTTTGMLIGAIAINTSALVGCLLVARRRGGVVLTMLVGLALAALVRSFGAAYLFHIWNPDLPVFPTAFLILATWSVIEGDLRLLPIVLAASCFAWQTHIGYLPLTAGLAAIAVVGAAVHLWRRRRERAADVDEDGTWLDRPGVLVAAAVVTVGVCLAPLLVEQVTTEPGNLQLIIKSFLHPQEAPVGLRHALRVVAKYLAPFGTWISGDAPADPFTAAARGDRALWLVVPALAVVGAAALAARARAAAALRFLVVTSLSAVIAVVAVSRTTGDPYNYLFNWLRPVGALLWASVAWTLYRCLLTSEQRAALTRPALRCGAAAVAVVGMLALSVSSLSNGTGLEFHEATPAEELEVLTPGVLDAVRGYDRVYLRSIGGWCAGELGQGLALQMIEHGTDVAVSSELAPRYGQARVSDTVAPTVDLYCGPVARSAIADLPDRPVATHNILTGAEAAELVRLQEAFRQRLTQVGQAGFLPNVDNQSFPLVVDLYLADAAFDQRDVDRFGTLMTKAQHSSSVFFRPGGPNVPP